MFISEHLVVRDAKFLTHGQLFSLGDVFQSHRVKIVLCKNRVLNGCS